jgi:c-di-GMP-binding flagellar brake protein YcgR
VIRLETLGGYPHAAQQERRQYPRVSASVQIELRPEDMDVPMRLATTDVSLGGCYVETPFTLDIGTKLDMVFWLGEQKIVTTGTVVTRHSQIGNGIEFTGMSSLDRDMLRRFQDSLDQPGRPRDPLRRETVV